MYVEADRNGIRLVESWSRPREMRQGMGAQ